MTYKIQVNKEVTEVYEMSDEKFDEVFTFDEDGAINYREWSDDEIAGAFEDHGKLVSKDWQHPEDPINWID
jgi:hypothetical protein